MKQSKRCLIRRDAMTGHMDSCIKGAAGGLQGLIEFIKLAPLPYETVTDVYTFIAPDTVGQTIRLPL